MPVHHKLRPFLRLQEIDLERQRLRRILESGETKRIEPRKRLAAAKATFTTADTQRLAKEKSLADAQLRLKIDEDQLKKLEKQRESLSSGREFKAMEHQIRGKKADMSLIEDEILGLMDGVEAARKEANEAAEKMKEANDLATRIDQEVSAAAMESLHALEAANAAVLEAERACDHELLSQYQMLVKRRNGVAVVPVLDRICQGCYTAITPQVENKALQGQVIACTDCQRFIYLP